MTLLHQPTHASAIEVLDRVLDKGIVIDAWVRVSLVGIDLVTVEARVMVASIETYLKHCDAVHQIGPGALFAEPSFRETPHTKSSKDLK